MSGHVTFFSVVLGAATMGMGGQVPVLSGYLLRFVHTIASARAAPSRPPKQTKAKPPGVVRKWSPEVQDLPGACRFHGLNGWAVQGAVVTAILEAGFLWRAEITVLPGR